MDRIIVLAEGRIQADGLPEEIYRDAALLARESLRPPEVTAAFSLLSKVGLDSAPPPVRLEDGIRALARLPAGRPYRPAAAVFSAGGVPILAARNLHHTYADGTRALRGVSVEIERGDYVLLVGQNGAGKSTLLSTCCGC